MQESMLKQRLTIQQFVLPIRAEIHSICHKRQKPSLLTNYQSEKKVIRATQDFLTLRERRSQELYRAEAPLNKLGSLPEIRATSRAIEANEQQRMPSFSSRKLNVNAYHKIQKSISSKYVRKMASMASLQLPRKVFTINTLKGDLPLPKHPEAQRQERVQRYTIVEKHHIDRLKDHFQIPMELQTLKCQQQEFDHHQLGLQLKNIIRFEFHTQMNFAKPKKEQQEEHTRIQGWDMDRSTLRAAAHLYC